MRVYVPLSAPPMLINPNCPSCGWINPRERSCHQFASETRCKAPQFAVPATPHATGEAPGFTAALGFSPKSLNTDPLRARLQLPAPGLPSLQDGAAAGHRLDVHVARMQREQRLQMHSGYWRGSGPRESPPYRGVVGLAKPLEIMDPVMSCLGLARISALAISQPADVNCHPLNALSTAATPPLSEVVLAAEGHEFNRR